MTIQAQSGGSGCAFGAGERSMIRACAEAVGSAPSRGGDPRAVDAWCRCVLLDPRIDGDPQVSQPSSAFPLRTPTRYPGGPVETGT